LGPIHFPAAEEDVVGVCLIERFEQGFAHAASTNDGNFHTETKF
jgi:hypothetical protein